MITLLISGEKKDKLRPGDIVGAIVAEAKIDFEDIGDISITSVKSYVVITAKYAQIVCEKLNVARIKNRRFRVFTI